MANADPFANVRETFKAIDAMSRPFSRDVVDTAKLLCRDLSAVRVIRSDVRAQYAACAMYLATRMHGRGIGRSRKEIAAVLGVPEPCLCATAKVFRDGLSHMPYGDRLCHGLEPGDLINRCVDRLGLSPAKAKAVKRHAHDRAARVPPEVVGARTPSSVCSGVVACALQDSGVELPRKTMVESCRVSAATIDKMAKLVRCNS